MTHPTKDWDFDDTIEEAFQEWFNDLCGGFSFRSEWFYDDAFEDGCAYGEITFARTMLECIGEKFEYPCMKEND